MDVLMNVLTGAGVALGFQVVKGDSWNRWVTAALALLTGAGVGAATNHGLDSNAIQVGVNALAMHGLVLSDTGLGNQLKKLGLGPRFFDVVAEMATAIANAMRNKPVVPPS